MCKRRFVSSVFSRSVTHHTSGLYGLWHVSSVGFTPEDVTVETMAASVHDEGKRVHVSPHAHEREETNTTLHQHFSFVLVEHMCWINGYHRHSKHIYNVLSSACVLLSTYCYNTTNCLLDWNIKVVKSQSVFEALLLSNLFGTLYLK